ncbi:uncharacterized protein L969DRAFT_350909 [Mixia osmundae IAM 14324]|uniref:uncharacterized protein n=1 Tax=Mixia osmundae (strain CBS 9802 / IAM 14324 / JCM 22182 / KY 12970) TaxID=764103 RepID=UPI0004A54D9B|nr:uncharacterized protein L969DRAFT_350909 [Mixia osmundae IAM 14324]KEI40715.1 hypothetical protein L969DRAFT_350909 [Mixia osmundae IAM 14324]
MILSPPKHCIIFPCFSSSSLSCTMAWSKFAALCLLLTHFLLAQAAGPKASTEYCVGLRRFTATCNHFVLLYGRPVSFVMTSSSPDRLFTLKVQPEHSEPITCTARQAQPVAPQCNVAGGPYTLPIGVAYDVYASRGLPTSIVESTEPLVATIVSACCTAIWSGAFTVTFPRRKMAISTPEVSFDCGPGLPSFVVPSIGLPCSAFFGEHTSNKEACSLDHLREPTWEKVNNGICTFVSPEPQDEGGRSIG